MSQWSRMPEALKEQVFQRLDRLAAVANLSEADRIAYDKAVDRYNVSRIVVEDAWHEGMKKGREEGREERNREIVYNLRRMGLSAEQIAQATGLSVEEVDRL